MKKYFKIILAATTCLLLSKCAPVRQQQKNQILQSFEIVSNLDLLITETSGLETLEEKFITHNDSDAAPVLYLMDTNGNIESQIQYTNMVNVDWEDITRSETHLFIADVGNNHGNRKDLKVYKIPLSSFENGNVLPEIMEISYLDQTDFSYKSQDHRHDAEAIVHTKDRLYLFSKNWVDFETSVFELNEDSQQKLKAIQEIDVNGLVTGAAFNGDHRIVLCGYDSALQPFLAVLAFDDNETFSLAERIELPLENGAQIEAISYYKTVSGEEIYYLTSEAVNLKLGDNEAKSQGQLYRVTLKAQ